MWSALCALVWLNILSNSNMGIDLRALWLSWPNNPIIWKFQRNYMVGCDGGTTDVRFVVVELFKKKVLFQNKLFITCTSDVILSFIILNCFLCFYIFLKYTFTFASLCIYSVQSKSLFGLHSPKINALFARIQCVARHVPHSHTMMAPPFCTAISK